MRKIVQKVEVLCLTDKSRSGRPFVINADILKIILEQDHFRQFRERQRTNLRKHQLHHLTTWLWNKECFIYGGHLTTNTLWLFKTWWQPRFGEIFLATEWLNKIVYGKWPVMINRKMTYYIIIMALYYISYIHFPIISCFLP